MEQNVEVKETQPKKKRNWLFTLFACIATGVIVFLAMNIGEDLGKTVDPITDSSNNKEVTCEEKECDCKEENTTTETNSNSNTTTNSNSNTTQQQPQTQPTTTTYTMDKVMGTYEFKTATYTSILTLSKTGLFTMSTNVKDSEGFSIVGNYFIENDTIKLNEMISQKSGGDLILDKIVTGKINPNNTITLDNDTFTKIDSLNPVNTAWNDILEAYVKSTEI